MDADELARRSAAAMYAGDLASRSLGITIDGVRPGHAIARMSVTDAMVNGHGVCHGGYVFLLADTAFAFACNTHGEVTVAAGADITFVTAARSGDQLEAEGMERTKYGRSGICDITVRRSDGEVIAEFRGRSRSLGRPIDLGGTDA